LQPCFDDFNNIGAGFGFPVRFKVEVSDDSEFKSGVITVANQAKADFPNPGTAPQTFTTNGATGRHVRVSALKLAPRKDDFIFALGELQVFDSTGQNAAANAVVTALDSIEAPPRWRKANLVDAIAPIADRSSEVTELKAKRTKLLREALPSEAGKQLRDADGELPGSMRNSGQFPKPSVVYAGTVHQGSGNFKGTGANGGMPRPIFLLARGQVTQPGKELGPGALSALTFAPARFALDPAASEGARRAALARWISDERNPLTWRSIVNRVWQYHFGRGIVETPNDFGRNGGMPSHPELLDWLAADFRDSGGSLKRLHKLIVTSATWRQQSIRESLCVEGRRRQRAAFATESPQARGGGGARCGARRERETRSFNGWPGLAGLRDRAPGTLSALSLRSRNPDDKKTWRRSSTALSCARRRNHG
jgi:hypothetical protein